MNGQAKNLFSAVYLPVERLETFAIDMRMSKGNIPCQLVANQLVDIALQTYALACFSLIWLRFAILKIGAADIRFHSIQKTTESPWPSKMSLKK